MCESQHCDLIYPDKATGLNKKSLFFSLSLSGSLLLCVLQAELGWLNRTNPSEGWHPHRIHFKALLLRLDLNIKMQWEKQKKLPIAAFSWQLICRFCWSWFVWAVLHIVFCWTVGDTGVDAFFSTEILVFFTFKWRWWSWRSKSHWLSHHVCGYCSLLLTVTLLNDLKIPPLEVE